MNKKTLAIAALALIATSGFASAQTVRQQPRLEREARIVNPPINSYAAVYPDEARATSPYARQERDEANSGFFDWRVGANTD